MPASPNMKRSRATNLSAVEQLFREEFGRMVVVLEAQLGDRGAAEECAQDAFVELVSRWDKLATYDDPRGWLWLVALRRAARVRDRRKRVNASPSVTGPGPEWDLLIDLHDAIQRLPARQRDVVVLHYFADLSISAVAAELGIAEGTVKSQLHDARAALRVDQHERRDIERS